MYIHICIHGERERERDKYAMHIMGHFYILLGRVRGGTPLVRGLRRREGAASVTTICFQTLCEPQCEISWKFSSSSTIVRL